MSVTELIAELELLGMEFAWRPGGAGWDWIEPVLPEQQQARLEELRDYASKHWDAFDAMVEIHLWRKDGTIR